MGFVDWSWPPTGERWYRVEDHRTTGGVIVVESSYPVLRHTPKGVWLNVYGLEKFVLKDARRRWACPTMEEAMESFLARKRRQRKILQAQLRDVADAIAQAETERSRV